MRIAFDYRRRGGQVRPYGPNEYDFTLTIEGDNLTPSDSWFDSVAHKNHPWQHTNIGGGPKTFWDWTLVDRVRSGNSVRYILRRAYDD